MSLHLSQIRRTLDRTFIKHLKNRKTAKRSVNLQNSGGRKTDKGRSSDSCEDSCVATRKSFSRRSLPRINLGLLGREPPQSSKPTDVPLNHPADLSLVSGFRAFFLCRPVSSGVVFSSRFSLVALGCPRFPVFERFSRWVWCRSTRHRPRPAARYLSTQQHAGQRSCSSLLHVTDFTLSVTASSIGAYCAGFVSSSKAPSSDVMMNTPLAVSASVCST